MRGQKMSHLHIIFIFAAIANAVSPDPKQDQVALADYKLLQRQLGAKQESLEKLESRFVSCKEDLESYTEEETKYEHHLEQMMKDMETLGLFSSKLKAQIGEKNEHISKLETTMEDAGLEVPKQKASSEKGEVAGCADQKLELEKELFSYRNRNSVLEENAKLFGEALTECNDTVNAKINTVLELEEAKEKSKDECDVTISRKEEEIEDMRTQLNNAKCGNLEDSVDSDDAAKKLQEILDKTTKDLTGSEKNLKDCQDLSKNCKEELDQIKFHNQMLQKIVDQQDSDHAKKNKKLEARLQTLTLEEERFRFYSAVSSSMLAILSGGLGFIYVSKRWREFSEEEKKTKADKKELRKAEKKRKA